MGKERIVAVKRQFGEDKEKDASEWEKSFYRSRFTSNTLACVERSYFYNRKRDPKRPPITALEHIRKKTKIPTVHETANFTRLERKNLKKSVMVAMKAALMTEVEKKMSTKREKCVDGETKEMEEIQSWAKDEIRKIREMKRIDADTMRRVVGTLNWKQIALENAPRYTGFQCYIYYINNEVPWSGKRFGKTEKIKLKAAIEKHGTQGKWIEISKEVHKDITPFQCLQEHMRHVKAARSRLPWTKDEDDVLRESVQMFGTYITFWTV